jgi:uncharacterized protein
MDESAVTEYITLHSLRRRSMNNEIEVLKQFYVAINRNDMPGITQYFDPQIVRIEPEGFPTSGTYRGIAEVQEHVMKGRGTWPREPASPRNF